MRRPAGWLLAGWLLLGAGGARADGVRVPIVDERGRAVFCTRDETGGRARPDADGGYRFAALRAGRWVVSIDLPHERVDVLVSVDGDGEVVVPPVVARGRCQRLSLMRRPDAAELLGHRAAWHLRFGRIYRPTAGTVAAVDDALGWLRRR